MAAGPLPRCANCDQPVRYLSKTVLVHAATGIQFCYPKLLATLPAE